MMKEKLMQAVFFIAACTSILAVALICLFLFANGIPAIREIGVFKFLLGTRWKPGNNIFGILPMIMGSIYVTAGAIIIGVPIGIMTSIFMAEYCPKKIYKFLKSATELLAGIPSVVWFLWTDGSGAADPGAPAQQRNQHPDSVHSSGDHDPSNDHRSDGGCFKSSAKKLL